MNDPNDHELLIKLHLMMGNHLKHHEKWEKFLIGIAGALAIALLVKNYGL